MAIFDSLIVTQNPLSFTSWFWPISSRKMALSIYKRVLVIFAAYPGPNGQLSCLHNFKIFWGKKLSYTYLKWNDIICCTFGCIKKYILILKMCFSVNQIDDLQSSNGYKINVEYLFFPPSICWFFSASKSCSSVMGPALTTVVSKTVLVQIFENSFKQIHIFQRLMGVMNCSQRSH